MRLTRSMVDPEQPLQRLISVIASRARISNLLTGASMLCTLQSHGMPLQQEVDLRDLHQKASKQIIQRLAECAQIERQFTRYDIYRSESSSKIYGVDVRGRVWTIKRDPSKGCSLQTRYRLNRPDYELDYLGRRTWTTFYYEKPLLCLYMRENDEKIRKRCYQPTGTISKLAPYFLN
jgi:hypothetical protein